MKLFLFLLIFLTIFKNYSKKKFLKLEKHLEEEFIIPCCLEVEELKEFITNKKQFLKNCCVKIEKLKDN